MILVDTSVWVDHLRDGDAALAALLGQDVVVIHPFVIGELAVGTMPDRARVMAALRQLPRTVTAHDDEVLTLIEQEALFGVGIGYVDAHLLASARLTIGTRLWTRDRCLAGVAGRLGLATNLPN